MRLNKKLTRGVSFLLALMMVVTLLPHPSAASGSVTVKIVSFARGEQADLRGSELLMAKVDGYGGNVSELTYRWYNEVYAVNRNKYQYVYVFNDQNMVTAQSQNFRGGQSWGGKGYRFASLSSYNGTYPRTQDSQLRVNVYTQSGVLLGSATYSGFQDYNLGKDLKDGAIGVFEGESAYVRDLFGQRGVTHITCQYSSVKNPRVGDSSIIDCKETTVTFSTDCKLTGRQEGQTQITLDVAKQKQCNFHSDQSCTAAVDVYVFKKPTVESTTTEIKLTNNTRAGYTYTIGTTTKTVGTDDKPITFNGLTPNKTYEIIVSAHTTSGLTAYAYLPQTTQPRTRVAVDTRLDGTSTRLGGGIVGSGVPTGLQLVPVGGGTAIPLAQYAEKDHAYEGYCAPGDYHICDQNGKNLTQEPIAVVSDLTGKVNKSTLSFYSLTAKVGDREVHKTAYLAGSRAVAPAAPGGDYLWGDAFSEWKLTQGRPSDIGNTYQPGAQVIANIQQPIVLTAQTVPSTSVTVNVQVRHQRNTATDGTYIPDSTVRDIGWADRDQSIDVHLWQTWKEGTEDKYRQISTQSIPDKSWITTGDDDGYVLRSDTTLRFNGLPQKSPNGVQYTYTVAATPLSNHYTQEEPRQNSDNSYELVYQYNPNSFNLAFRAELQNGLENILKSVEVKVTYWDTTQTPEAEADIVQHRYGGVELTVPVDGSNALSGTYPVWQADGSGTPYHYGIRVVGYVLRDGTSIAAGSGCPFTGTGGSASTTSTHYDARSSTQIGTPIATITGTPRQITYNLGDGIQTGVAWSPTPTQGYTMPNLENIAPAPGQIKEGYVFLGWELQSGGSPPNAGAPLTSDVTLVAQWAKPVTISGRVTAVHSYNGGTALESDRLKSAEVILQRRVKLDTSRDEEEGWQNWRIKQVGLSDHTTDVTGLPQSSGDYIFDNLPSMSPLSPYEYRVRVVARNYDRADSVAYSSPNNSVTDAKKGVEASPDGAYAIDLKLPGLNPETVPLAFEIDATDIGAGFRHDILYPNGTAQTAYVGFHPTGGTGEYTVIKQMADGKTVDKMIDHLDGTYFGQTAVWQVHTSGTLSRYQMALGTVTVGGENRLDMDEKDSSDLPYTIEYGQEQYFDPERGTIEKLTAKLAPKWFPQAIELNGGQYNDSLANSEEYSKHEGNWTRRHIWSQNTPLATPTRSGYTFTGWKATDADGNDMTSRCLVRNADGTYSLNPALAESVTLTAQWSAGGSGNGGSSGNGGGSGNSGSSGNGGSSGNNGGSGSNGGNGAGHVSGKLNTTDHMSYIRGYEDGTVRPERHIQRSETATIFFRLLSETYRRQMLCTTNQYPDVPEDAWYNTAVSTLSAAGIFQGMEDGGFHAERLTTRAEFAAIVVRFAEGTVDAGGVTFTDVDGSWASDAIRRAAALKWIQGYEDGAFRPNAPITRAEAVTIINRMLDRDQLDEHSFLDEMETFPDNPPSAWYYEAMQEAANSHTFRRTPDRTERWQTLPGNPDWGQYE